MSSQRPSHQSNKVHFFKVIVQRTLRDGELMVPRSFVKKYGKELPNPVILRVPHGPKWKVSWIKRDNDIWFKRGWERFAQHYSLSHGHFLVFNYDKGGSDFFQVMIFDKSASEIDYWSKRCSNDDGEKSNEQFEDGEKSSDFVEVLDDDDDDDYEFSEGSRSPLPRRKRMKTNADRDDDDDLFQRRKREKRKIGLGLESAHQKGAEALEVGIRRALERAKRFPPKKPFFIRQLFPSYLQNILVIPTSFSKKYMHELSGVATIWVDEDEDRPWSVNFKFNSGSNRSVMTTGWTALVQKYNLQEGDVCVFEMIDHSKFHFKVTIYRAREQCQSTSHPRFQDSANPSKEG